MAEDLLSQQSSSGFTQMPAQELQSKRAQEGASVAEFVGKFSEKFVGNIELNLRSVAIKTDHICMRPLNDEKWIKETRETLSTWSAARSVMAQTPVAVLKAGLFTGQESAVEIATRIEEMGAENCVELITNRRITKLFQEIESTGVEGDWPEELMYSSKVYRTLDDAEVATFLAQVDSFQLQAKPVGRNFNAGVMREVIKHYCKENNIKVFPEQAYDEVYEDPATKIQYPKPIGKNEQTIIWLRYERIVADSKLINRLHRKNIEQLLMKVAKCPPAMEKLVFDVLSAVADGSMKSLEDNKDFQVTGHLCRQMAPRKGQMWYKDRLKLLRGALKDLDYKDIIEDFNTATANRAAEKATEKEAEKARTKSTVPKETEMPLAVTSKKKNPNATKKRQADVDPDYCPKRQRHVLQLDAQPNDVAMLGRRVRLFSLVMMATNGHLGVRYNLHQRPTDRGLVFVHLVVVRGPDNLGVVGAKVYAQVATDGVNVVFATDPTTAPIEIAMYLLDPVAFRPDILQLAQGFDEDYCHGFAQRETISLAMLNAYRVHYPPIASETLSGLPFHIDQQLQKEVVNASPPAMFTPTHNSSESEEE